ncbi:MAG: MFS transporter [Pseudomonadota bacterium]|nr:MFS transporter [Pseudomonadota bacterium]
MAVLPRSLLVSVIPVEALTLMSNVQAVSLLYFISGIASVLFSLLIPILASRFRARGLLILGGITTVATAVLLNSHQIYLFVVGMIFYTASANMIEIALTLFIMQVVPRREIQRFEPMRVFFMVIGFLIGPWLGVVLREQVSVSAPYFLSGIFAVFTIAFMLMLRLHRLHQDKSQPIPANPVRYVQRFSAQPRLRLAWALAVGRAGWWSMFFIYAPLYAVTSGLGEIIGGAIVSAGVAMVLTVHFWGWIGRRYGLRRMMFWSALMTTFAMLVLTAAAGFAWLGAALWLVAAATIAPLDAAGNGPFLRAVRSRERPEMAGVYNTYRDMAQLMPPGIFSVVLRFFELPAVFATTALGMLGMAALARYLPRRF